MIVPSEGVASSACSSTGRSWIAAVAAGSTGSVVCAAAGAMAKLSASASGLAAAARRQREEILLINVPPDSRPRDRDDFLLGARPSPDVEGNRAFGTRNGSSGYTYVFRRLTLLDGDTDAEAADLLRHCCARRRIAADGLARAQQQPVRQCRNAGARPRRSRAAQLQGRQECLRPAAKPIPHARLAV